MSLGCGLVLLRAGGAPASWMVIQTLAGAAALALLVLPLPHMGNRASIGLSLLTPAALLATILLDPGLDGVHRWLQIGGFRLHPGQILLPAVLMLHARDAHGPAGFAIAASAVLLAVQPDLGTAIGLLSGVVLLAMIRKSARDWIILALVACATIAAWAVLDPLQPVAMVEHVLTDSWGLAPWAGPVALAGALAFPLGLWLASMQTPRRADAPLALAAFWSGLLVASLIGPFPVPVLGYGVSAIIGFGLAARLARQLIQQAVRSGLGVAPSL